MTRLLLAAALAGAALLAPAAATACDLTNCVPGVNPCERVPCQVCYQNEYERWCIPGE